MIEYGDKTYHINIDALENLINTDTKEEKEIDRKNLFVTDRETKTYLDSNGLIVSVEILEHSSPKSINLTGSKYDIIRMMLETIIDSHDEQDDTTLGSDYALNKSDFSFKLAFNTLLKYDILIESEE